MTLVSELDNQTKAHLAEVIWILLDLWYWTDTHGTEGDFGGVAYSCFSVPKPTPGVGYHSEWFSIWRLVSVEHPFQEALLPSYKLPCVAVNIWSPNSSLNNRSYPKPKFFSSEWEGYMKSYSCQNQLKRSLQTVLKRESSCIWANTLTGQRKNHYKFNRQFL